MSMKKIIVLLFLVLTSSLFSQTKEEVFLDENNKTVTKQEFEKKMGPPEYAYIPTTYEDENAIIKKLVLRRELGIIKEQDRLDIVSALEEITGQQIDPEKTIIINFFYEDLKNPSGACIDNYSTDRKYKKYLKQQVDITQFFVVEKGYIYSKKRAVEDRFDKIRKMLFFDKFHCGNYIIIKPNGHYFKQVGEYPQDDIPKILEAEW